MREDCGGLLACLEGMGVLRPTGRDVEPRHSSTRLPQARAARTSSSG